MGKNPSLFAFTLFLLLFASSGLVFAQGTTSRVTGNVSDASGAAVAGATVTLTNEGTNTSLTTQTSDSGAYTFDLIQPGNYTVTVERQGFKRFVSKGNPALINQPATVNVALEVGDVSATITVESTAEQVQTSSSGNIGSTVEQRTLESLPIVGTRGRNPLDLLNYQPGVVSGANTGGGVHVNGSRDRSFNFTLDGIDINESSAGGSNFTPLRPNPDSIQEFQVVTSGFTAELGRSSGAQVTFVTRSGTNDFRGNLFEYYQTPRFNARSYAANVNNAVKEQFVQHIYGGSFGGPLFNPGFGEGTKWGLLKDKAFFFVNLQLLRASDTAVVTRTVYTQSARQGIFRWVRGGTNGPGLVDSSGNPTLPNCSASVTTQCIDSYNIVQRTGTTLDPLLLGYVNAMPLPNNFSAGGDGLNTSAFVFSSPQREKQYDFSSKFDFKLNETNSFYFRYSQGEQNSFGDSGNGGRPRFPDAPNFVDTFRTPKNFAFNWRWSPTARFTNEFIVGQNRFAFDFLTPEPDPNYPFIFNNPTDINTNFSYNARRLRTWQFVDNLTFDLSPHIIKAGVNIRLGRQIDDRASVAGTNIEPTVNFSRTTNPVPVEWLNNLTGINSTDRNRLESTINDLLGRVGGYSRAFVSDPTDPSRFAPVGTRWIFTADYPELDFYVQDTWKWRPNFTVDLGVRMEAKLSPSSADGRPVLVPNKSVTLGSAPANDIRWTEGKLFDDDYVFMPSVGFAWDPFKKGKTSIRMNYRLASDRFGTQLFASAIWQNAPGNTFLGANDAFGLLRNGLPPVNPTSTPDQLRQPGAFGTGSINVIDPDLVFPRIHSWTASFQQEVWGDNVIEVNYIGKKGTHLFGGYDANQVNIYATLPGISQNFLEAFNSVRAGSNDVPFFNLLFTGSATDSRGTARFRALNTTGITQGSVATLALQASQKTCSAQADVTAGICTAQQLAATVKPRIIDLRGFSNVLQPYSQFTGGLFVIDSNDYSFYNGFEFIFKRRIKDGLGFELGYTWSVSKDTRSFDPVFTTVGTGTTQTAANTPFDNRDRRLNYSWSDFDRRHSLVGTYVFELPFGRGKWLASESPKYVDFLIGGWQLAGNVRLQSGRPFTVFSGLNTFSNVIGSTANCDNCPRDLGKIVQADYDAVGKGLRNWFFDDASRHLFSQPLPGEQGNTPRNYFIGPSFFETDVSLSKRFRFTETLSFDLRVDVKNLTNTPNFNAPSAVYPAAGLTNGSFGSSLFGRINADVTNNNRRIQFSGKLNF
ncbi:MAG TPA: carboxypeptidase regulatory-like domain-containing protein [Pyrinomonadaceae bacterium]|jgi:hypothetical protein